MVFAPRGTAKLAKDGHCGARNLRVGSSIPGWSSWVIPINLCPVKTVISPRKAELITPRRVGVHAGRIRASKVESYGSSPNFVERMERAWLISQQPRPVACSSCHSNGNVECKWCGGTGFFIIGDNMLCQVPSRNTACVICSRKGFCMLL
ncbi:uncharacterized protein Fot_13844 [Forsythia ovata]|uniref:Guanylate cyclase domain-containing protein n=1 Tax=Forsythia ovata TaxID=205694 RepID=A0ABD1W524_9LAMI